MEIASPFLTYLRKFVNLTDEEFNYSIVPIIKVRRFGKREILTKAGEVENYFNFIVKGLVRKYYKKNNNEINTQISLEGHIILSQESFHSRTPSEYFIETIEPSVFVSIPFDDLERLYTQSKKNGTSWQACDHSYDDDQRPVADANGKNDTERKVPEFCNEKS